jgi:hypothetical protein
MLRVAKKSGHGTSGGCNGAQTFNVINKSLYYSGDYLNLNLNVKMSQLVVLLFVLYNK